MSDLPAGWEWAEFSSIAEIASNLVDPADHPIAPHIAPNHIESRTGRLLSYTTVAADRVTSSKNQFYPGQLLYSKIRPNLAKVVAVDFGGLCSADMYPIDSRIDRAFLKWWMLTPAFTEAVCKHAGRSLLPKVNAKALATIPLPVPPTSEQRRIVASLEGHLSRLDAGGSLLEASRRQLRVLGEQVLAGGCTGLLGMDSAGSAVEPEDVGLQDGVLPRLPAHWQWARLRDIADVVGGVTKDAKRQSDPDLRDVPYLRVANVQRGRLDLANVSTIRVSDRKIDELALRPGDVLLNEGGDRDKLARGWIWEGQLPLCIHQNHVFRARIRDNVLDPRILAWHANSFGQRWAEANGKQSVNLASISLKKIRLMPVPIPPQSEQGLIVSDIEENNAAVDRMERAITAGSRQAEQLRRSLLADAFAGRLVPQDPTDEPASVLLERIRAERAAQPKPARRRKPIDPAQETLT